MEHKITNTGDYLLIVNDSEIKEGDWVADFRLDGRILVSKWNEEDYEDGFFFDAKKIIAHLPLNNSSILEGVDLLPQIEDEVEKLAKNFAKESGERYSYEDFKAGYNKAKEKYKYTEEDIKAAYIEGGNRGAFYRALEEAEDWDALKELDENYHKNLGEFIQSLQQPKIPVGFSTLEQWYNPKTNKAGYSLPEVTGLNDNDGCYMVHSVITNSQGLTQWIGEYIY